MIYKLKALEIEFEGPTLMEKEELKIDFENPTAEVFSKYFAMQKIIEAQRDGKLNLKWLSDENPNWEKNEKRFDDFAKFSADSLRYYISISNSAMIYDVELWIIPTTGKEMNVLFKKLLSIYEGNFVNNAMVSLPKLQCLSEFYGCMKRGGHVIADYIELGDSYNGNWTGKTYWYLFKEEDLNSSVVTLYAPEYLVPHVIGKGGKNIKEVLERLKGEGYTKVRKIEVKSCKLQEGKYLS